MKDMYRVSRSQPFFNILSSELNCLEEPGRLEGKGEEEKGKAAEQTEMHGDSRECGNQEGCHQKTKVRKGKTVKETWKSKRLTE